MSDNLIYTKILSAPEIDRREILRYAGVRESTPEIEKMLDECIRDARSLLSYRLCYCIFDIEVGEREIDLGFTRSASRSLNKALFDCKKIILFCATVGAEIDRLIARYSVVSPARAVLMQALGTERVEALCDSFCKEINGEMSEKGYVCTRRFSPGYGDLPLDMQREIFSYLDCTKRIGVNLNDNLFMTPSKSVTAIIGIKM